MKNITLIALSGPPGSGKSTLARNLIAGASLAYVDTGECWKALFPNPRYSPEESERVFEMLVDEVSRPLDRQMSVIADGIFASHSRILRLKQVADRFAARLFLVGLRCDFATAQRRMESRYRISGQPVVPEKMWKDLLKKLQTWEDKESVLTIDSTTISPELVARAVCEAIQANRRAV